MPAQLTPSASDDFTEIIRGAALRSRGKAMALLDDFQHAFDQIGTYPGSGEIWRGTTAGLRFKRVRPGWLIFYKDAPTGAMVDIVRIRWATADLEAALADLY